MKKTMVSLLAACFLVALFAGHAPASDQIVLKLAHITAPNGMLDKKAQKFAELVSAKTQGKVKVQIFPAQQLGNIKEIMQGISMGTIDLGQEAESFMETYDKDLAIYATPFMFSSAELFKDKYLNEIRGRILKKTGIRTLPGLAMRPAVHLWTQKRQVMTPDELKGIKLRVWQNKALVDTWNGLGATAVPLPWGDVYLALSQKVVEGMVHNIVQVRDEKFFEQLNYCTKLDWLPLYDVTWINETKYKSLPKDVQKALSDAAQECADWFISFGQSLEAAAQQDCQKGGIVFAQAERGLWVKKAKSIFPKLENQGLWTKGLLKKLGK